MTETPTTAPLDPTPVPDVTAGGGPGTPGLQVLDRPITNDLVDTIVGDVAGAYFGN